MRTVLNTISDTATVMDAARTLAEKNAHDSCVIVLKAGRPVGMVTERDLICKVVAQDLDATLSNIPEIMSALIAIDPDADLSTAATLMADHNMETLVVMRDGIIYGVMTSRCVTNHFRDYLDRTIQQIVRWTLA